MCTGRIEISLGKEAYSKQIPKQSAEKTPEMFFHLIYYSLPNAYACQALSLVLEQSLEEGIVYTRLLLQFWDPVLISTKSGREQGSQIHHVSVWLMKNKEQVWPKAGVVVPSQILSAWHGLLGSLGTLLCGAGVHVASIS